MTSETAEKEASATPSAFTAFPLTKLAAFVPLVCLLVADGSLFSAHPIAAGVALVLAVAAIEAGQVTRDPRKRPGWMRLHTALQLGAGMSLLACFSIIWRNKDLRGKDHLTSNHALAGTFVLLWWAVQMSMGFYKAYFSSRVRPWFGWSDRYHRLTGMFGMLALLGTLLLGVIKKWGYRTLGDNGVYAFVATLGIVAVGLMLRMRF